MNYQPIVHGYWTIDGVRWRFFEHRMTYDAIAAEMGLTRCQVAGIVRRLRRTDPDLNDIRPLDVSYRRNVRRASWSWQDVTA